MRRDFLPHSPIKIAARRLSILALISFISVILVIMRPMVDPFVNLVVLGRKAYWNTITYDSFSKDVQNTTIQTDQEDANMIPKIIHHTWKSTEIPESWNATYSSCIDIHRPLGYTNIFWTDASIKNFINTHYPEFTSTFASYRFPIQRADAMRYFVLYHFGGFYIDMDIGCHHSLEAIRQHHVMVFAPGVPLGFTNAFMGAPRRHDLFRYLTLQLPRTANVAAALGKHATVMLSAGSTFLALGWASWRRKHRDAYANSPKFGSVLSHEMYWHKFFFHAEGNSWHGSDEAFFLVVYHSYLWFANHPMVSMMIGLVVAALLGFCVRSYLQTLERQKTTSLTGAVMA